MFLDGEPDDAIRAHAARSGAAIRPQGPGGLGGRLARAFRLLRAAGAERVVAIGADSPTLDPARIVEAFEALRETDVVIGPTEDGGYYLLGSRIDPGPLVRRIPWGTPRVLATTLRRASDRGIAPRMLPVWYDLDEGSDLLRAAEDVASCPALAAAVADLEARLAPATTAS